MDKKKWKRPKLIVLVRGKPEEAVLQSCKNSVGNMESSDDHFNCAAFFRGVGCVNCAQYGGT